MSDKAPFATKTYHAVIAMDNITRHKRLNAHNKPLTTNYLMQTRVAAFLQQALLNLIEYNSGKSNQKK